MLLTRQPIGIDLLGTAFDGFMHLLYKKPRYAGHCYYYGTSLHSQLMKVDQKAVPLAKLFAQLAFRANYY